MIRYIVSWGLFWLGDGVSKIMNLIPDDPDAPEYVYEDRWQWKLWSCLYPIYSKLMLTSLKVQGDIDGPWER